MGACQVAYMAIISVAEASVSIEGQTISLVALEPCEVLLLARAILMETGLCWQTGCVARDGVVQQPFVVVRKCMYVCM